MQDVSGASGSARKDTITARAQGDQGETKCPMPGTLMMVALDSFAAAASAPASDVNVSKVPEMSSVGMALSTGWCMASGSGDLPDVAAVFVEIGPAADTLVLDRCRIVGKRLPAGRGEILRRGERIAFATADAKGQPIAEGGGGRIEWRRPSRPIQGDRRDSLGAAGSEPIDPIGAATSIGTP